MGTFLSSKELKNSVLTVGDQGEWVIRETKTWKWVAPFAHTWTAQLGQPRVCAQAYQKIEQYWGISRSTDVFQRELFQPWNYMHAAPLGMSSNIACVLCSDALRCKNIITLYHRGSGPENGNENWATVFAVNKQKQRAALIIDATNSTICCNVSLLSETNSDLWYSVSKPQKPVNKSMSMTSHHILLKYIHSYQLKKN